MKQRSAAVQYWDSGRVRACWTIIALAIFSQQGASGSPCESRPEPHFWCAAGGLAIAHLRGGGWTYETRGKTQHLHAPMEQQIQAGEPGDNFSGFDAQCEVCLPTHVSQFNSLQQSVM